MADAQATIKTRSGWRCLALLLFIATHSVSCKTSMGRLKSSGNDTTDTGKDIPSLCQHCTLHVCNPWRPNTKANSLGEKDARVSSDCQLERDLLKQSGATVKTIDVDANNAGQLASLIQNEMSSCRSLMLSGHGVDDKSGVAIFLPHLGTVPIDRLLNERTIPKGSTIFLPVCWSMGTQVPGSTVIVPSPHDGLVQCSISERPSGIDGVIATIQNLCHGFDGNQDGQVTQSELDCKVGVTEQPSTASFSCERSYFRPVNEPGKPAPQWCIDDSQTAEADFPKTCLDAQKICQEKNGKWTSKEGVISGKYTTKAIFAGEEKREERCLTLQFWERGYCQYQSQRRVCRDGSPSVPTISQPQAKP